MPRIVAFSNQKGGVGKTTCTRELGLYLSEKGHHVCLVDADPQANLTKSLTDDPKPGLYNALSGMSWEITAISETLSILAGSLACASLEKILLGELDAYNRLQELLSGGSFQSYDYILIDCPPSLGVLTINALAVAHYLVVPMNPSMYSMQGTNDLMQTVSKVKKTLNPWLNFTGVVINAYERNPVITQQIVKEIEQSFGGKVFASRISKAIAIEEAIASRTSVTKSKTRVSDELMKVGDELLERIGTIYGESNA
jgi:chromosome partitioning protein